MRWVFVAALLWAAALYPVTAVAASRLKPPVLPLTVRNPYLSTWLGNARGDPWSKWPMFWTGQEIGMSLMAQIPSTGAVYPLVGRPHDSLDAENPDGYHVAFPIFTGSSYDASTTNLTYHILSQAEGGTARELDITISFLSPITPTSTLRQSIPASYVDVFVKGDVNVNIYMDVNGQWVSGDRGSMIEWRFDHIAPDQGDKGLLKWEVKRQTELLFTEFGDRAEWGALHFMAPPDVRYESGTSALLRQRFSRTGTLQNVNDPVYRTIMDHEPVFAYAKSFRLGNNVREDSVTFTIAHIQDPVVQFAAARGLTLMKPLWQSWFADINSLILFHYHDLNNARLLTSKYSNQLAIDAFQSGAEDYVDIVALSARQVLGATSFSGTAESPVLFLKEISSNGNCQTVDVIFPSFPFFLYTNPRWLTYLLEPLFEHMLSGQYPNKYSMHDLGSHFPNMTGHPDGKDEYMPVEECGNMLIMTLAVVNSLRYPARAAGEETLHSRGVIDGDDPIPPVTGIFPLVPLQTSNGIDKIDTPWIDDGSVSRAREWVDRSYTLIKQWTGYLVEFSLLPENQLSTDDFAGWLALQTNLALKGIVGINAMSELSRFVENRADTLFYKNISDTYISKWEGYGFSRDKTHAKVAYDWYGSWTTLYNMYADALLCFHLDGTKYDPNPIQADFESISEPVRRREGFIPKHVYTLQSKWYQYVRQKYGLPLDSRHLYTKSDWEFFAMAVASESTRHEILESVALWVNETAADRPMTDLYKTEGDGGFPGPNFFARPVVGGHFAFLALEKACKGMAMDGLAFLNEDTNREPDANEPTGGGGDDESENLMIEIQGKYDGSQLRIALNDADEDDWAGPRD
ncbi:glutaminase [Coccidioides immitis RS]|uniref:Glutaminase n=3 Tax=Coccidioides immitis TaxID=5501 RepID=J3KC33_COCIM|nr:glutaminase [Coccidioides immitis RS]EAS32753.3 glutaminase [Coccidioides immitis RS]KMP08016.1 glutaminase GtaA [Coccidioides immitis RMSCC 2394]KMU79698.1 glutaminase GtaA [Coccidioides immitis RMSCC 3703]